MADYLNTDQVVQLLDDKRADRTLEEFAAEVGVSYQYLGHIFRRVRTPGRGILKYLGLRKITVYQKDNGRRRS
jgi:AraC-like DNA-binding protein